MEFKYWKKLTHDAQEDLISDALSNNIDHKESIALGIPASKLDPIVFHEQASFLKHAPLLRAYVQNPNHIGCHTTGDSEPYFNGTQKLEREVIELLSVDLLKAEVNSCDGYIATGGTEANIQAVWIYRNYFIQEYNATQGEIALISSEDTHYSVSKAANLLCLPSISIPVDNDTRMIIPEKLDNAVKQARQNGIKYFIVIANMATTMFGSVDDPDVYAACMDANGVKYKMHVDGAFGGFIFPVSCPDNHMNFGNPNISSLTLDAHKMLQAPYGTGIFIARKGLIEYVYTRDAKYVSGMDLTLCGSRSGANAVAVWMILFTYGPYGWLEKINKLLYRTKWICRQLDSLGIKYYRHPNMNIITVRAKYVAKSIADKYGMVPDTHSGPPGWYKIVVMDHVEIDQLEQLMEEIRKTTDAICKA